MILYALIFMEMRISFNPLYPPEGDFKPVE